MTWGCANCERDNLDRVTTCVHCSAPKPSSTSSAGERCRDCSSTDRLSTFTSDTLVVADRGARLCASCSISALRRRAEADRRVNAASKCDVPGCPKSVAEHIAEAKALASSETWTQRFESRRERRPACP